MGNGNGLMVSIALAIVTWVFMGYLLLVGNGHRLYHIG
jgi:hypothetical protein